MTSEVPRLLMAFTLLCLLQCVFLSEDCVDESKKCAKWLAKYQKSKEQFCARKGPLKKCKRFCGTCTGEDCTDLRTDCAENLAKVQLSKEQFCEQRQGQAKKCQKLCGTCGVCMDKSKNCAKFLTPKSMTKDEFCATKKSKKKCQMYCGTCNGNGRGCMDKSKNCAKFLTPKPMTKDKFCSTKKSEKNCKKFCGTCNGNGTEPTTTTTEPRTTTTEARTTTTEPTTTTTEPTTTTTAPRIHILVKTEDDKTIPLDMVASDTIKNVKTRIFDKDHIPVVDQTLTFAGKWLANCRSLSHYHIQHNATLKLFVREN